MRVAYNKNRACISRISHSGEWPRLLIVPKSMSSLPYNHPRDIMSANGHNAGATASASTSNSRGHKQLPRDTRLVALMLSQYAEAADPGVLAQLTEFAHRPS